MALFELAFEVMGAVFGPFFESNVHWTVKVLVVVAFLALVIWLASL